MSAENAKIALALRGDVSRFIDAANQLGSNVGMWYHAEMDHTAEPNWQRDNLAGMEMVSARNQVRELKRQLDAIMEKLGGW